MDKKAITQFNRRAEKPCAHCTGALMDYLSDALTHAKLAPYLALRKNLLVLHVHEPGLLDDRDAEHAFSFLTVTSVNGQYVPYFTPSGATLDAALDNLKKTLELEDERLQRRAGRTPAPGKNDDAGAARRARPAAEEEAD